MSFNAGLFLLILGKSNFFFGWEFSSRLFEVVSYWVKNVIFLTVIYTTFHLIIIILFSGAIISDLVNGTHISDK